MLFSFSKTVHVWSCIYTHTERQNNSFCCSGPLPTLTRSLSLIIKWALVPQCYGSGLCTRGHTALTPLCTHASAAADFHSTLTSTEGQIVEVQETTRSTSEYYKAILCLVVLRLGHIKHCWANCHRQNPAIPQDQESYVRANKRILMQMWFCMHCMDQCFIPVIQHALRIQSASCTSVQIGNLTIWCTYLILHLRYFEKYWQPNSWLIAPYSKYFSPRKCIHLYHIWIDFSKEHN